MRIRSIKPEFYRSLDIAALDWDARLVFIGLWSYVDDNGVGRDVEQLITADLFPLDGDPTETLRRVSLSLDALFCRGLIARYEADGKRFLFIVNWDRHQLVKNPNKPRYPRPTTDYVPPTETLRRPYGDPTENLPTGTGEQGNRGTGEQGNSDSTLTGAIDDAPKKRRATGTRIPADFIPDEAARAWFATKHPGHSPEFILDQTDRFRNHFGAQSGQRGVKANWSLAWRNWMSEAVDRAHRTPNGYKTRQQETDDLFARAAVRMGVIPADQLAIEGATA